MFIFTNIGTTKTQNLHLYKQRLFKFYKVYEDEMATQNRHKKAENAERRKTCFWKELVEMIDLSKPVLNKIMPTHEKCVKPSRHLHVQS